MTRPQPFLVLSLACMLAPDSRGQCETQKILASDYLSGSGDNFASSIAISGNTAIVGAVFDDDGGPLAGSAYILDYDGVSWSQTAKLKSSDLAPNDRFGHSVDIDGATVIVGTRYEDTFGYGSGSAYIFERVGGTWIEKAKLVASDPVVGDFFGQSVAISGTIAVVGTVNKDSLAAFDMGAAYIYEKQGASWIQVQKLTAPDAGVDDRFGYSLDLDGNTLFVSAVGADVAAPDCGAVYVFQRLLGSFVFQKKLVNAGSKTDDLFGFSVRVAGDRAIVGSVLADGTAPNAGAAFVYERIGGSWTEVAALHDPHGSGSDYFGHGVAIFGDSAIVGAWGYDLHAGDIGRAFYYHRHGGAWVLSSSFGPAVSTEDDTAGFSVALDGDTAILGGRSAELGAGAVWVFQDIGNIYAFGDGCEVGGVAAPRLSLTGCFTAGGTVELRLENAGPGGPVLLLLGAQPGAFPLGSAGCSLFITPPFIPLPVPVPPVPGGLLKLNVLLPQSVVAGSAVIQAFVPAPTIPLGFVSSNGVVVGL